MKIIVEAIRIHTEDKMIITKKVTRMSSLEKVVSGLREACEIWEFGPKKKVMSPPQGSP